MFDCKLSFELLKELENLKLTDLMKYLFIVSTAVCSLNHTNIEVEKCLCCNSIKVTFKLSLQAK